MQIHKCKYVCLAKSQLRILLHYIMTPVVCDFEAGAFIGKIKNAMKPGTDHAVGFQQPSDSVPLFSIKYSF